MSGRSRISLSAEPLLYILHGTETGNAEGLAFDAVKSARALGLAAKSLSLDSFEAEDLPLMHMALFIVSTAGDGDMPYTAENFWDALGAADFPSLEGFHFAVLALGDSVYEDFCQAGKDLDAELEAKGAARVAARIDCDWEYAIPAAAWIDRVLPLFQAIPPAVQKAELRVREDTGRPWFDAEIIEKRTLTRGEHEALHYGLRVQGDVSQWQPGDSVSIGYPNDPELVETLLSYLGLTGEERFGDAELSAREDLAFGREVRLLSHELIEDVARRAGSTSPFRGLSTVAAEQWRDEHDLLELLRHYPDAHFSLEEWGEFLHPLRPRAYSLASDPRDGAIDLTVRTVSYHAGERDFLGVVSGGLARRSRTGEVLHVQHRPHTGFHLPDDPATDIVMVGPGVGVAPFRAFLQRRAQEAQGRNWLFQGVRDASADHLYADDFEGWREDGTLTRYDLCVSRAASRRSYVQHRMKEQGAELFEWLDAGAILYVCGDARRMAPGVQLAVRALASEVLGSVESGQAFVDRLRAEGRYRQDVY